MHTTREDAGITVIQQFYRAVSSRCNSVKLISNDTGVFVLLAFFYLQQNRIVPFSWRAATVAVQ